MKIKECFENDYVNHILWLPIFFIIGILLKFYFTINFLIPITILVIGILFFKNYYIKVLSISIIFVLLGYFRTYQYIKNNKHNQITEPSSYVKIDGIIKQNIKRTTYTNRVIREIIIESDKIDGKNHKILLKIRLSDNNKFIYNSKAIVKAVLFPIKNIPFGFDSERYYYFQNIGGLGYKGEILYNEKIETKKSFKINDIRTQVANRIINIRDSSSTGIIAILLTGKRDMANKKAIEYMNFSGMAHLLSISGLHMMTLIGIIFFIAKSILLRFEKIALNYNVFKISATISLLINFLYLLLSGSSVSAVRAYLMSVILLISIVIGRFNTSIRSVMFVMFVVLFIKPYLIFSAGFQMSFMAVIILISSGELLYSESFNKMNIVYKFILAGFFTSFMAECATTPFSIYNFNNYSFYNVFVNSFLTPLVSFIVLPLSLLSMILYPLHLESIFILPASYIMDFVLYVSKLLTELPNSVFFVMSPNLYSLFFMIIGLLWFSLWQQKWRYFGILFYSIGLVIFFLQKTPDIIITNNSIIMTIDKNNAFVYTNNRYEVRTITRKFGIDDFYYIKYNFINCLKNNCIKILINKNDITFIKNEKLIKINKTNKNIISNNDMYFLKSF